VLALLSAVIFWFCARHNSGEGRDVAMLEKLIWLLPLLVVPIVFTTIFVPGAKNWWWLGRAIVFTFIMLMACAFRIVNGFGSGSKGQDAAVIVVLTIGVVVVSVATAVAGAMILAATKPAFANWFQAHKILGSFLTALSVVPIGFVLGITATFGFAIVLGLYVEIFKR
ncbi:MAG TPA: hypothetical protein PKA41_15245, partial [Verrucomicrobiota bacterium]|nr:hypothetical protein [Verrucomicrobiota bacterium]